MQFKSNKENLILASKGFAMGMADIVPGVSGGTIALVTGIYNELVSSIAKLDKAAFHLLFKFKFQELFIHMNAKFLIPLAVGIFSAIIIMSKVMHFFMHEFPVYTWSLFFGLIIASVIFVSKQIPSLKSFKSISFLAIGTIIGYAVVSLIPVSTPDTLPMIFLSGSIAICAMILPGISGSFILLIFGKYLTITSALKNPFADGSLLMIIVFSFGCLIGLILFSKFLNYLLTHFYGPTMAVLTGFMIGSLKKIWPWKNIVDQTIIRGKVHVLEEQAFIPSEFSTQVALALLFMILGFILIFAVERLGQKIPSK